MYTILGIKILTTGKRTSGTLVNPSDREKVNFDYITNQKCDMYANRSLFCVACDKKHHLLLRKRERMHDGKLVGSRQRSPSCRFILPRRDRPLLAGKYGTA